MNEGRNPASAFSGPVSQILARQAEIFRNKEQSPTRNVYQQMLENSQDQLVVLKASHMHSPKFSSPR
jgi:hypothetical protein